MILTGTTTPGKSGSESNSNERVFHNIQNLLIPSAVG